MSGFVFSHFSHTQIIQDLLAPMPIIYSELDGVPCEYKILERLGKGGFSEVFKCERTLNGEKEIFVSRPIRIPCLGCESLLPLIFADEEDLDIPK